ncbi:hypothetical protein ABZW11_12515 [Nonomuraea sp. NPDC004580]|uniref:hypothetical protein n=1 Tax=Nonomuraea sp. NPDC004580 TaxID=3154552 RepID=UPI00339FCB0C
MQEFTLTVTRGDQVWARETLYGRTGTVRSRPFVPPARRQSVKLDVSVTTLPSSRSAPPYG